MELLICKPPGQTIININEIILGDFEWQRKGETIEIVWGR